LNPAHPDFSRVRIGSPDPFAIDQRPIKSTHPGASVQCTLDREFKSTVERQLKAPYCGSFESTLLRQVQSTLPRVSARARSGVSFEG